MKTKLITLLIVVLGLLSACGGRNSNQENNSNLDISVKPQSMEVGQTDLIISITEKESGDPINDASVAIKGDMSHAGMQPVLGESSSGDNGVYTIPYEWTMAGDWFITVDVTLADGTAVSERFDFSGIGDGEMGDMDHSEMEDMDHGEMEDGDQ